MTIDTEDLKTFKKYLNTIQFYLDKYFDDQKEYICCHKGCSHCCEKGSYPYSEIEFNYLMLGFFSLNLEKRLEIIKRIKFLKKSYEKVENKDNFMYRCPFLGEDKVCTVYEYRGLICRTFGLLKPSKDDEIIMPFCQSLGLNYSKVYNRDEKRLDEELIKKYNYQNRPKAYQIGLKTLMSKDLLDKNEINFGEIKSLIDWL